MEIQRPSLPALFSQLGLPAEPEAIARFIRQHAPLAETIPLHEAPFWTPAQASFLCSEWCEDADWAEVVDELNRSLRAD